MPRLIQKHRNLWFLNWLNGEIGPKINVEDYTPSRRQTPAQNLIGQCARNVVRLVVKTSRKFTREAVTPSLVWGKGLPSRKILPALNTHEGKLPASTLPSISPLFSARENFLAEGNRGIYSLPAF